MDEQNQLYLTPFDAFMYKYETLPPIDYEDIKRAKIKLIGDYGIAESIRDYGGLWGVYGIYLLEGAKHLNCSFAEMVDITPRSEFDQKIIEYKKMIECEFNMVVADFRDHNTYKNLRTVDISLLYEVILHQENHVDVIKNVVSKTKKCVCFAQPVLNEEMFLFPNTCINLQFYPEELKDLLRFSGWWHKEPVVNRFDTRYWMWGQTVSYIISLFYGFGWELSYQTVHEMNQYWNYALLRFIPREK